MLIFSPRAGRISRFNAESEITAATITFPGFDYLTLQAIVVGTGIQLAPIYQANDSIGGDIHLLSFGEAMSSLQLRGLLFDVVCDPAGDLLQNNNIFPNINRFGFDNRRRGIQGLIEWWQRENLSNREAPVQLTLGEAYGVRAYIAEMQATVDSSDDRLWRFTMNLLRIPARRESQDARFASVPEPPKAPAAPADAGATGSPVQSPSEPSPPVYEPDYLPGFGTLTPVTPSGYDSASTPLTGPLTGR